MNDDLIRNYATLNDLSNQNQHNGLVDNIMNNDIALDNTNTDLVETMNEALLEEFKDNVQAWMDLDNQLKRLEAASKQRKTKKKELNEKILDFMAKYNIEDLNTKQGVIRYKKVFVKEPLSQKIIKEKLSDLFRDDQTNYEKIEKIFTDRGKVEKQSLRRLKL
tara:strand:+ start:8525 stop:9013 length:489 start_codon:yes stop_codon:yes gene_type:complete